MPSIKRPDGKVIKIQRKEVRVKEAPKRKLPYPPRTA